MDINIIKCLIKDKCKDIDWIVENYFNLFIKINSLDNITFSNFSIFYLFDNYNLNKDIGYSVECRKYIRDKLNLDSLMKLNLSNIIDVGLGDHSTIFYKFENREQKYIYYSNSGLGIEKNQFIKNKSTSCRIYYIENEEIWNNMGILIQELIEKIKNFSEKSRIVLYRQKMSESDELWNKLEGKIKIIITKEIYNKLVDYVIKSKNKYVEQYLCYQILDSMRNDGKIIECTFNYVLYNKEHPDYLLNITDDSIQKYKIIANIEEPIENSSFKQFINKINIELQNYNYEPTIRFKLNNSFQLFYSDISGLYNNIQQSGSCVFYSYYNLAINMLILHYYNHEENIEEIIKCILEFHYTMIYLFCISFDTIFTPNVIEKHHPNNIYYLYFINNILKKEDFLDEIIDFYGVDKLTFLFNRKTPVIDKLLSYKVQGILQKNILIEKKTNDNLFIELIEHVDYYLNLIRNRKSFDFNELIHNIRGDFNIIIKKIQNPLNILYDNVSCDSTIYFQTLSDIYILYFYILIEIFKNELNLFEISKISGDHTYSLLTVGKGKKQDCKYDRQFRYNRENIINLSLIDNDILLLRLNLNELLNVSNFLNINPNIVNELITSQNIKLDYCEYIYIYDYILDTFQLYYKLDINLDILQSDMNGGGGTLFYINKLYHKFIYYKKIKDSLYETRLFKFKNHVLNYINLVKNHRLSDIPYKSFIIYILTDNKLLLYQYNKLDSNLDCLNFIDEKTEIIKCNFEDNLKYILNLLINEESEMSEKIGLIKDLFQVPINDISWIETLNFTIPYDDLINGLYTYEGQTYKSLKYYQDGINLNGLVLILSRFGISFNDNSRFLFLYDSRNLNEKNIILSNFSGKIFILLFNNHKCIELSYNKDRTFNKNECYIFDLSDKVHGGFNKNKLIFDLEINKFPFRMMFPEMAPYLCYNKNNNYILEFIVSGSFSLNHSREPNLIYNNSKKKNNNYLIFNFKIAPSLLFPLFTDLESYNNYLLLLNIYEEDNLIKLLPSLHYNLRIQFPDYIPRNLLENIKSLYKLFCDNIDCSNINLNKYQSIILLELKERTVAENDMYDGLSIELENNHDFESIITREENKLIFKSYKNFMKENRLCTIINDLPKLLIDTNKIKDTLIEIRDSIRFNINYNRTEYINDNLINFLLMMTLNLLIKMIMDINESSSCWDIQNAINTIVTIYNFYKLLSSSNIFYKFELLFLFQSEYFLNKHQIKKYNEIKHDLFTNNRNLKLHQFMMGKGKTSVFTPLLSFFIIFVLGKIPTIITIEHLVNSTRNYTIFLENLTNTRINIFTDYEAKERWIKYTDYDAKQIKEEEILDLEKSSETNKNKLDFLKNINLENEINLIDEFDTHHNYLQSMFNYVVEQQYISEKLFKYIFNFTNNKIKLKEPTFTGEMLGINIDILNEILELSYQETENMRYNENYGFEFKIFNDINNESRICSPFSRRFTPVKKSDFSSLIIRLILTFKIYITHYDYQLNDELFDFNNLLNYNNIIIELLKLFNLLSDDELTKLKIILIENMQVDYIKKLFTVLYSDVKTTSKIKEKILLKYLYEVNKKYIKNTSKQINISFQDIIYNNYQQLQVGYTGTIYMNLNNYEDTEICVFKTKIEDVDEMLEVKLALIGYGNDHHHDRINKINNKLDDDNEIDLNKKLLIIKDILKGDPSHSHIPRGFVDLAGLFLNYDNKEIAKKLKNMFNMMNIVYLSLEHDGIEYDELIENKKYKENAKDNFYYYDQTHVIGSDLKQPRNGHILIIITSKTRMTEFSQAIFRFRKLNRGTYLSVLLVDETDRYNHLKLFEGDDNLYVLLKNNEKKFNENQILGLEYQLLKTLVRKNENIKNKLISNYTEYNLLPEYTLKSKYDVETTLIHLKNDIIKNLNDYLGERKYTKIHELYSNLSELNETSLKSLVLGSGNNIVTQQEQEKQQEQIQEHEHEQEININQTIKTKLSYYKREGITVIHHLNCSCCNMYNCIKFFNNNEILINNKEIYISFNLLTITNDNVTVLNKTTENFLFDTDRICFVEFNDKILIELETICMDYYIYKLPIYSVNGKLIVPHMFNSNNIINPFILDIDVRFVKILGIKKYINPIKQLIIYDLDELRCVINDINPVAFLILSYLLSFVQYKFRYNPSLELLKKINETDFRIKPINDIISPLNHNKEKKDHLLKISYEYAYEIPLKLNLEGYENEPPPILYRFSIFYLSYKLELPDLDLERNGIIINTFFKVNNQLTEKNKYLKYKEKYIKLKQQMNI